MKIWILIAIAALNSTLCRAESDEAEFSKDWFQLKSRTENWANIWGGIWSTATAAQLALGLSSHDTTTRGEWLIGAGVSSLGLIPTWILRPSITSEERPPSLAERDEAMARYSRDERFNSGVMVYAFNFGITTGVSLVYGFVYHDVTSAIISETAGFSTGALMALTYPNADHLQEANLGLAFSLRPCRGGGSLNASVSF